MTAGSSPQATRARIAFQVAPGLRLWSTVVPLVVMGVLLVVHAGIIAQSMLVQRLWEDEAFNLTVPLNFVAGLGYSSDGTLTGSVLTPFDERISTGPVMLLPVAGLIALGVEPVFAGRLIAAWFWCLLIAGLWVLGRRIAGAWGGLVAAAVPLALNTFQGISPIQGPADVLGEVAAASLIVWAIFLLPRKPVWAGLVIGLAIQAKFIALLALPALTVGVLVVSALPPRKWWGALWPPAIAAMAPTALYELWALLSLGWNGFVAQTKLFVSFLRSGGQQFEPTTLWQKIDYLSTSWFVPPAVFWFVSVLGAVAVVTVFMRVLREPSSTPATNTQPLAGFGQPSRFSPSSRFSRREVAGVGGVALLGLLTYLLWWSTASQTPLWIRHPAPALFSFVPVLAAVGVLGVRYLGDRRLNGDLVTVAGRATAALISVTLAAVLLIQLTMHTQQAFAPRTETLEQQRAEAAELRDPTHTQTWLAAKPWGATVSIVFLTGSHVGLFDAPSMAETPRIQGESCEPADKTLAAAERYFLCQP